MNGAAIQRESCHMLSSDSYESALHGLLALGSTAGAIDDSLIPVAAVSIHDFAESDDVDDQFESNHMESRPLAHRSETRQLSAQSVGMNTRHLSGTSPRFGTFTHRQGQYADTRNILETSPVPSITTSSDLELLRLYRYHIAPWLDICDPVQHFGVTVLTSFSQVPGLRIAVMRLAVASSGMAVDVTDRPLYRDGGENTSSDIELGTVMGVLSILADALSNLSAFWLVEERVEKRIYLLERSLLELDAHNLSTCAHWLLVRLGKS